MHRGIVGGNGGGGGGVFGCMGGQGLNDVQGRGLGWGEVRGADLGEG